MTLDLYGHNNTNLTIIWMIHKTSYRDWLFSHKETNNLACKYSLLVSTAKSTKHGDRLKIWQTSKADFSSKRLISKGACGPRKFQTTVIVTYTQYDRLSQQQLSFLIVTVWSWLLVHLVTWPNPVHACSRCYRILRALWVLYCMRENKMMMMMMMDRLSDLVSTVIVIELRSGDAVTGTITSRHQSAAVSIKIRLIIHHATPMRPASDKYFNCEKIKTYPSMPWNRLHSFHTVTACPEVFQLSHVVQKVISFFTPYREKKTIKFCLRNFNEFRHSFVIFVDMAMIIVYFSNKQEIYRLVHLICSLKVQ